MQATPTEDRYELYYWPGIRGRGEFVRLAFEKSGTPYVDVAALPPSDGGGVPAMLRFLKGQEAGLVPLAPPFLRVGALVIAQTANILAYLGPRIGLAPDDEASRLRAQQLQLTLADLVSEIHDVHHPIASSLYFEDQKPEAIRRAGHFLKERAPKYLGYFERILERDGFLASPAVSYVDLGVYEVMEGLRYAFPKSMPAIEAKLPGVVAVHARVAASPRIAAYRNSPRCPPLDEKGLYRRYVELDLG